METPVITDYAFNFRPRSDRAKLKIYNPTRGDTHNYTLKAYSANMNSTATVQLHVTGELFLQIVMLNTLAFSS